MDLNQDQNRPRHCKRVCATFFACGLRNRESGKTSNTSNGSAET